MKMCVRVLSLAVFVTMVVAPAVQATPIIINAGASLVGNAAALAAFNRAASTLGNRFSDPIQVLIDADLAALGPGIIGSTSATLLSGGYSTVRDAMVADAADESDDAIVGSLPTAAQFSTFIPSGFSLNGNMVLTQANAKALGFSVGGLADASITFSSAFGFDYDNSDGVGAGLMDFETVALHELIHALGFISWVDQIDGAAPQRTYLSTLDMYRFRAQDTPTSAAEFTNNPRSLVPGGSAVTSDVANTWAMSTGLVQGDGRQASHFKDDDLSGVHIGVMDPTLSFASAFGLTFADIRALDLIGWDDASPTAVPEPASIFLLGSGLVVVIRRMRRRGQPIQ